jgi:hypothetical protein
MEELHGRKDHHPEETAEVSGSGGHPGRLLPVRDRSHVQRLVRQGDRLPLHARRPGDHPGPRPWQPFFAIILGILLYQIIESSDGVGHQPARLTGGEEETAAIEDQILEPAKAGSIFWGTVLVALGALLLLANFDVIDYDTLFDFWPLAVIGLGIKLVFDHFARGKKA